MERAVGSVSVAGRSGCGAYSVGSVANARTRRDGIAPSRRVRLAIAWVAALAGSLAAPAEARGPYPVAIAIAPDGAVYVADPGQAAILRLEKGALVPVAKGEGRPRTPLYNVRAVAVDPSGGILAGDPATFELYRIGEGGAITPVTGGALLQPFGIAVDAKGRIYVADLDADAIYRIGEGGKPVKVADVDAPTGLAADRDGSLVAVTRGADNLVRIAADGKVTPIIGGRKLAFPHCVAVDPAGGYFVTDGYGKAVWRVTAAGEAKPLARGGPLENPVGLAREPAGTLLVTDPKAGRIFRIGADGKIETVVDLAKGEGGAKK